MKYDVFNPPTRPDPLATPGQIDSRVTIFHATTSGFTSGYWRSDTWVPHTQHQAGDVPVRNVSTQLARQVWSAYFAYASRKSYPHRFEIDHLVPLSLGGTNSALNLWPQPNTVPPWNAGVKDSLEDRCILELNNVLGSQGEAAATALLEQYQQDFKTDWIALYLSFSDLPHILANLSVRPPVLDNTRDYPSK